MRGLLIKVCEESKLPHSPPFLMGKIGDVAFVLEVNSTIRPGSNGRRALKEAAQEMGVKEEVVLRLATKLTVLRQKKLNIHLRACNLDPFAASYYKFTFDAARLTFHACRLLFIPMGAEQVK